MSIAVILDYDYETSVPETYPDKTDFTNWDIRK